MNNQKVSRFFKRVKKQVSDHKPEILTAIGIGCMLSSTVAGIKATPKALTLMEMKKAELKVEELTPVETVKTTWKCYIPSVVTGVIGVGCLVSASTVNAKRTTALATAYKLSETALSEYKEKVIETIGEKKEKTVRDKVAKKKLEDNPVTTSQVIVTNTGDTLCYDLMCGRYFKSDIDKLKKAVNVINERMLRTGYISLNDFYEEVGLVGTDLGERLGWNTDDGLVELYFGSHLSEDGTPCLTVEFENAPKYDYYKFA